MQIKRTTIPHSNKLGKASRRYSASAGGELNQLEAKLTVKWPKQDTLISFLKPWGNKDKETKKAANDTSQ